MKKLLFLSLFGLGALPAMCGVQPFSLDVNAGTQGAGLSLGYQMNPSIRLRLRGALLSYSENSTWTDTDARLKLYGNNVGLLVDYFPGEGNFYISAGLNFCESKMRCRARMYREPGRASNTTVGGIEYALYDGTQGDISGKYSWNHVQPYIGIGYQDSLFGCTNLYYSVDLGINIMGSGDLSVGSSGDLHYHDPANNQMVPATNAILEQSIRNECRDFFKIADDLCVYPVLQFAIGARF